MTLCSNAKLREGNIQDDQLCWGFIDGLCRFRGLQAIFPIFREEWLNRDYSLDFYIQRAKQVFLYMIVKRFAEIITEGLYSHGGPPRCSFSISITYIDKLGQPKVLEAVTWQFTQKRASEVNWEKIDPRNFSDIALDYKFGPQVSEWTAGEPSFGPPSTPSASCDVRFLRANSIFIRATTYCAKDYMDSPAGYYALAMSRQCAQVMTEEKIKTAFMSAAKEIDDAAKKGGKAGACGFVDQILMTPRIFQIGPKTSAKSGCSCSMPEKRCISGRSLVSGIMGIRS